MGAKLTSRDLGFNALIRKFKDLAKGEPYVAVGVVGQQATAQHDGGLTNAQLAAIHEFGAPSVGVPERSFLRSTLTANRDAYIELMRRQLRKVVEGALTITEALGVAGLRAATDVKRAITSGAGIPPPLQPATIARKGSTRALVDTGRLLDSITWEVRRK